MPSGELSPIEQLLGVMRALRHPQTGCAWDLEQDFASIAPYTIEEAYEVDDAIRRGNMAGLKDELGDLLLQVVFHAQIAADAGLFDFDDIARGIADKMVRRHPHVFGDAVIASAAQQVDAWEAHKTAERNASGALAGVTLGLPALMRAQKIQKRAARVGFDWPDASGPRAKVVEELAECEAASDAAARHEEVGDLLFACVNLARHLGIDAEHALRDATNKFEHRFATMEAATDAPLDTLDLQALEVLWVAAKGRAGS